MSSKCECILIEFNKVDSHGDVYLHGCISESNLNNLKIRGKIIEYHTDEKGIKIVSKFDLDSVSLSK